MAKEAKQNNTISNKTAKKKHPIMNHKWTIGQKAADKLTGFAGSWTFIIIFILTLIIWVILNVFVLLYKWDPYPFILLNLVLSSLAAIQAPIIMMSQNRAAQRDRLYAQYDYKVNLKAEREIRDMQRDLEEIKKLIRKR